MSSPLRLSYQTVEFGLQDIHVCSLRDNQQFYDPDNIAADLGISSASWPIFGVLWPSSLVLAHYMLDYNTSNIRILEIGCGIGLTSLLLNHQHDDITATDYHPEVAHFLERNAKLNQDESIAFERVDWADDTSNLGKFDLIVGSDLLYEDQHIQLLADFIHNHAKPKCDVILVDPDRGRKNKLSRALSQYQFSADHLKVTQTEFLEKAYKGHILRYFRG